MSDDDSSAFWDALEERNTGPFWRREPDEPPETSHLPIFPQPAETEAHRHRARRAGHRRAWLVALVGTVTACGLGAVAWASQRPATLLVENPSPTPVAITSPTPEPRSTQTRWRERRVEVPGPTQWRTRTPAPIVSRVTITATPKVRVSTRTKPGPTVTVTKTEIINAPADPPDGADPQFPGH